VAAFSRDAETWTAVPRPNDPPMLRLRDALVGALASNIAAHTQANAAGRARRRWPALNAVRG
jgi:hypothetical protein